MHDKPTFRNHFVGMKILPHFLLCLLFISFARSQDVEEGAEQPLGPEARETTELFHVSRVGRANAAETRESLIDFYREIEAGFNEQAIREFREQEQAFAGSRVRVIEDLGEEEAGKSLYLVAYQGQPSVFLVDSALEMKEGELTPALEVVEAGTHETTVTRIEVERIDDRGGPSLETADTGGATFFGIPVGGAASTPSEPESGSEPKFKRKRVTEVKSLSKFQAASSQVVLEKPPVFSKDLFLSAIKNGELYELNRQEQRRCQNCGGFKRVQTDLPFGQRAPDGKKACPECQETGKVLWDVTYRVTW